MHFQNLGDKLQLDARGCPPSAFDESDNEVLLEILSDLNVDEFDRLSRAKSASLLLTEGNIGVPPGRVYLHSDLSRGASLGVPRIQWTRSRRRLAATSNSSGLTPPR